MTVLASFNPSYTEGQVVTPAAASANIQIGFGKKTMCLTNLGANVCYVRCGLSGVVATTADYPVPVGAQVTITKNQDHTHLAHISASGTTLHAIPGEGF